MWRAGAFWLHLPAIQPRCAALLHRLARLSQAMPGAGFIFWNLTSRMIGASLEGFAAPEPDRLLEWKFAQRRRALQAVL